MGYVVVVEVSNDPSARSTTIVFNTAAESATTTVPGATRKHWKKKSFPSTDVEGSPDASCQIHGAAVGFVPIAREHSPLVMGMDCTADVSAVDAAGLYSSTYTGRGWPSVVAGKLASPTRTTSTESGWNRPTRGDGEPVDVGVPVGDGVFVREAVRLPVGVLLGVRVDDGDAVPVCDGDGVADGDWPSEIVAEGLPVCVGVPVGVPVVDADAEDDDEPVVVGVPDSGGVPDGDPDDDGVPVGECVATGVVATFRELMGASVTPRYTEPAGAVAHTVVVKYTVSYTNSWLDDVAYSTNVPADDRPPVMQ